MTTKDDSFNASDIDYLESRLIDLAGKAGKSDSDNKKRGNPQKVDLYEPAQEAPASFALSFQLATNCHSKPAERDEFRTCLKNGICAGDTILNEGANLTKN